MRHLGSLIAGILIAPVAWCLIALGQAKSAATVASWIAANQYDTKDLVAPAGYLAAAGVLIGLIATLRISPVGPLVAGLLYAGTYVGLFFAPFPVRDAVPNSITILNTKIAPRAPLDNGTLLLVGVVLLMAVFSAARWRRRPVAPAEVAAAPGAEPLQPASRSNQASRSNRASRPSGPNRSSRTSRSSRRTGRTRPPSHPASASSPGPRRNSATRSMTVPAPSSRRRQPSSSRPRSGVSRTNRLRGRRPSHRRRLLHRATTRSRPDRPVPAPSPPAPPVPTPNSRPNSNNRRPRTRPGRHLRRVPVRDRTAPSVRFAGTPACPAAIVCGYPSAGGFPCAISAALPCP